MSEFVCPRCGADVPEGRFCSQCGASLESQSCPSCGADAPPGDRFCTQCGSPLSSGTPGAPVRRRSGASEGKADGEGDGSLGWWVAGLLLVALILLVLVPVLQPERGRNSASSASSATPSAAAPAAGGGLGPAPNVDLSSMTPREAADRLFNRIMSEAESGDTAQAEQFLPMGIGAYERARPLNADGLFHLSVLQRTAREFQDALATAKQGLADSPDHLLLLSAAAQASRDLGDSASARKYYSHLLDVWDKQQASDNEDYKDHAALLPTIHQDAEAFVKGG